MLFYQLPVYIYKKLYPQAVFELENKNEIALTFDDGPVPKATEFVLDVLKHYQIKATFFCVGNNIQKNFNLFERIVQEGHTVGNHTYSHLNGWKTKDNNYLADIQKATLLCPTPLFRPPYGKIRRTQYRQLLNMNYQIVFWSIITYDYHPKMNPQKCFNLLKKHTAGGQIVLFHDSEKSFRLISKILPQYIEFCQKLNLTFVPLKN